MISFSIALLDWSITIVDMSTAILTLSIVMVDESMMILALSTTMMDESSGTMGLSVTLLFITLAFLTRVRFIRETSPCYRIGSFLSPQLAFGQLR